MFEQDSDDEETFKCKLCNLDIDFYEVNPHIKQCLSSIRDLYGEKKAKEQIINYFGMEDIDETEFLERDYSSICEEIYEENKNDEDSDKENEKVSEEISVEKEKKVKSFLIIWLRIYLW